MKYLKKILFPKINIINDPRFLYIHKKYVFMFIINTFPGMVGSFKIPVQCYCETKQCAIDNKRNYIRIVVAQQLNPIFTFALIIWGLLNWLNGALFNENIRIMKFLSLYFTKTKYLLQANNIECLEARLNEKYLKI